MANCITRHIPNTITSLSLVCGCLAIITSFKGYTLGSLASYQLVWVLIGVGAILDFCDGLAARLLDAKSAIGVQLDSLADLVTFGVAPAMMMYNAMVAQEASWQAFVVVLIPVLGAVRLARFNIDDTQTTTFRGLPIPACAIFLIGFDAWLTHFAYSGHIATMVVIALISLAMVSDIRMFSLKLRNLELRENFRRYFIIVAAIGFVCCYKVSGLAWTILLYILISLLGKKDQPAEK